MSDQKPLNTGDPESVKQHEQAAHRRRQEQLNDMRAVLAVPAGRRVLMHLLDYCGVADSVWQNSAAIHRNAGAQDVGHHLVEEILAADPVAAGEFLVRTYQAKGARKR